MGASEDIAASEALIYDAATWTYAMYYADMQSIALLRSLSKGGWCSHTSFFLQNSPFKVRSKGISALEMIIRAIFGPNECGVRC